MHRDIKPGNVLISRAGDVKLTDFGVTGSLDNTMAKMTTFVGTARYMAPEQLGGKAYSFPADVWALGICLAEFATGVHPYEHYKTASHMELLLKMRSEPMPELPDAFSAGFRQFVGLCCRRRPGAVKRPQRSLAFSYENQFCMGLLYGRARRLTALFGVFRPGQWTPRAARASPPRSMPGAARCSPRRCPSTWRSAGSRWPSPPPPPRRCCGG